MKLGWPLGFGLAVLLLNGGCEYWSNLVGGKKLTQVPLSIRARDALTGELIPFSVCEDPGRGVIFPMDNVGQFKAPEASTGSYALVCRASGYYDTRLEFTLDRHSDSITASLARLGGQDWYPEEFFPQLDSLRVGVFQEGNLRVPGEMVFRATPFTPSGAFRYRWKSAQHPQFNRDWSSPASGNPELTIALKSLTSDENLDTIYLFVRSRLRGLPDYDVDSVAVPVNWVRNQKPHLQIISSPPTNLRLGCLDENSTYSIVYKATDPDGDGHCDRVSFISTNAASSFGRINFDTTCGLRKIVLPLSNPFLKIQTPEVASLLFDTNYLNMTVWDDNNQSQNTILRLITYPHASPTNSIVKMDTLPIHFTGKDLEFRFLASIADSRLERLIIDWGDSIEDRDISFPASNSIDLIITHKYMTAGFYQISSKVFDGCGDSASFVLKPLFHVQNN